MHTSLSFLKDEKYKNVKKNKFHVGNAGLFPGKGTISFPGGDLQHSLKGCNICLFDVTALVWRRGLDKIALIRLPEL